MHLGGAVLIVAALVAAEASSADTFAAWPVRIATVAAGGVAVVFAAAAIAGFVSGDIRSNPSTVRESLRGYSRMRRFHTGIWFVASLSAVTVAHWPQWIEQELHRLILLDELLILLPVIVPMYFSHAAFFDVDRAAAAALGGESAAPGSNSRWSYAWWFVRHEFGLILLPLLLLFAVRDVTILLQGSDTGATVWVATTSSLLVLLAAFPLLLRNVWPCEPLTRGELRDGIERQCREAGEAAPRVFKWNTGGRVVNAVVTGTLPGTHCVLLSDALLKHFSRDEVLAVVRHELAHARRHHVLLRIAAMLAPLAACYALGVDDAAFTACERLAAYRIGLTDLILPAGVALGVAAYIRWIGGPFSRLLEHEADLIGCREPGDAASAQAALGKLGCVYGFDRRGWLHPTIRTRLRILRAADRRLAIRARLLARTRRWKRAILLALVAALACCL